MLTISKALSAGQARTYHAREFMSKKQNYWSRDAQVHGEWQGRLAQEWGLRDSVVRPDRPGKVPSMYLGQAHFFEEALEACEQPDLWRAKTNNMPKIYQSLAQFWLSLYIVKSN